MEDVLYQRYGNPDFIFEQDTSVGIKKLTVALTQYNEDKLFDLWSRSMSDKPYNEWKKDIERKAKERTVAQGGITGTDLAIR